MNSEQRLNAEDAITRILFAYCTGIDTGNLDDTAQLFEHGAWFLNPDQPMRGSKEVAEFLHKYVILYDGVPKTRHAVSNIVIDLNDSGTRAHAQSYVMVYQAVSPALPEIIFQGAYNDTFVNDTHGWHFDERRIITDGIGDMSRHLKNAQSAGSSRL